MVLPIILMRKLRFMIPRGLTEVHSTYLTYLRYTADHEYI